MRTGRSRARPSRSAALPWLSARDRWPSESSIRSDAPTGTLPKVRSQTVVSVTAGRPPWAGNSSATRRPGDSGPIARLEVGGRAGERHVAEDQDVDDLALEHAVPDRRPGSSSRTSEPGSSAGPTASIGVPIARCAAIGAKTSRPWKRARDDGQHQVAVLEGAGRHDPAQPLRRRHEQPVVRPDQDVAAADPERDAATLRPDAGIDDRHVDADRHVREGERERARALPDRVARHLVADVDDQRIRRDPVHHATADGRSGRPEVRGEGDDGTRHGTPHAGRMRTGRSVTIPSRAAALPWLSAIASWPNEFS